MKIHKSYLLTAAFALTVVAPCFADSTDEVCKMAYGYYYVPFDQRVNTNDAAVMQIKCLTGTQKIADDELINHDMVELLDNAKIDPDKYRQLMASAMQFACIRNSTGTKGFTYAEFKKSQCGVLRSSRKAK